MKNKLQSLIYIHSSTVLCHLIKFKYYSRLTVRISFWKKHHEYHINVVHLSFSRPFHSFNRMAVSKSVPFPHRIRPHKAINTNAKYNWQSVIILYSVIQTSTEKKKFESKCPVNLSCRWKRLANSCLEYKICPRRCLRQVVRLKRRPKVSKWPLDAARIISRQSRALAVFPFPSTDDRCTHCYCLITY